MDGLSCEYASGGTPTPVTVTFSVPWNVAIGVVAGEVTPAQVSHGWLAEHAATLQRLTRKVRLRHGWAYSQRTLDAIVPVLSPRAVIGELGAGRLLGAIRQLRHEHPSVPMSARDGAAFLRWVATAGRGAGFRYWDPAAVAGFRMTFPARVRVTLKGGRTLEAERDVPRGGAGNDEVSPRSVGDAKLRAHGPALWGVDGTERIADAIARDDDALATLL